MDRKWLPNFAELIDRLSIHQLKEVFISEHKEKYRKEMRDIVHDIELLIKENDVKITGNLIKAIVILAQLNVHIWYNESNARKGEDQDIHLLRLTHGLNGVRTNAMNRILELINDEGRRDWKTDCLAAEFSEWEIDLSSE